MNIWKLSWSYLRAKPFSTALSLVLVALGVGLASFLLLVNHQFQDRLYRNIEGINLVVAAKGSPLQMITCNVYHVDIPTGNIPLAETKWLSKNQYIEKAIPLTLGDNYKSHRIVGTEHSYVEHYKGELAQGKLWAQDMEVTIGSAVAERTKLGIGNKFYGAHGLGGADTHSHADHTYKVVGILKPTGTVLDQLILTNISSTWRVHEKHEDNVIEVSDTLPKSDSSAVAAHTHDDGHAHHDHAHSPDSLAPISPEGKSVTAYLVRFKKFKNEETGEMETSPMARVMVAKAIDEHFTSLGYADPPIQLARLLDMTGLGMSAVQMMAWLIIGVSAFSMFISLYNSLKERKYELALLRVMGASRLRLFLLVVIEGIVVALLGFLLGELLSHLGMSIMAGQLRDAYQYEFSGWIFLQAELFLLLGTIVIGFLSALIPALQAYSVDISRTISGN